MSEFNIDNMHRLGTEAGVFGTALGLAALTFHKLWRVFSAEKVDTRKDQAESTLYDTLRSQIDELRREIDTAKTAHTLEREGLELRIDKVETQLRDLSFKYRRAQKQALEAYIKLNRNCPDCTTAIEISSILEAIYGN